MALDKFHRLGLLSQALVSTLLLIATSTSGQQQQPSVSSVKVLLLGSQQERNAIEEASSLSLDSSSRQPVSSGTPEEAHKQPSLASLTLHQPTHYDQLDSLRSSNASRSYRAAVPISKQSSSDIPMQWSEINLPKIRPSWLNASSKFKLMGNSIKELEYMVPTEYMLRPAFDSPILLKTKLGILEGVRSIMFNKNLYTFLSVPYAKPPVEELRFKAPQPVERWNGILQTTKWPPFCVQPSMTLASKSSPVHILSQVMSEDCLYLNIWTPSLKTNKQLKRPVMVWIHGGSFQFGGISADENDGSALALLGDVVVVTLSYRLSALGFLNAQNLKNAPNNVGLLDQQLALKWVHENIKQFGGDPQQVTLFGESAGGHSVGLHMISPGSYPYFKRAILQSGVPLSFLRSYDVNPDNNGSLIGTSVGATMLAKRLKCYNETELSEPETTTTSPTTTHSVENELLKDENEEVDSAEEPILDDATIECMRSKSSLEILKALGVPGSSGYFPTGDDSKGFFPNGRVQDSYDPEALKIGPQKDFIIGTNENEGTFMLHFISSNIFPAKSKPKVSNLEQLQDAFFEELEKPRKLRVNSTKASDDSILSAAPVEVSNSGQAHLLKPLFKTKASLLDRFIPKSHVKVLDNGTVIGNTTEYSKEAEFGQALGMLISDVLFLCPARVLARTLSGAGRNVYVYMYGHRSKMSQWHEWMNVTHHDEVEFVFGRPLRLADVYSGKDIEMSQRLIKTWSHFAYTGQLLDQLGIVWPKYGEEENNYITLMPDSARVGQRLHDRMCNLYETIIMSHLKDN